MGTTEGDCFLFLEAWLVKRLVPSDSLNVWMFVQMIFCFVGRLWRVGSPPAILFVLGLNCYAQVFMSQPAFHSMAGSAQRLIAAEGFVPSSCGAGLHLGVLSISRGNR